MECVVYLFRATDLRLFDNRALAAAFRTNKPVLLAACIDVEKNFTRKWLKLPAGGALRRKFHIESVQDISNNLGKVVPSYSSSMSPLSIFFGSSVDFCQTILSPSSHHIEGSLDGLSVSKFSISQVFVSKEHGAYERKEEADLRSLCESNKIVFNCLDDSTMIDFDQLIQHFPQKDYMNTNFAQFPDQFTEFRGMVETKLGKNFASDGSGCNHPPAKLFCDQMTGNVVDDVFTCMDKEECLNTSNFRLISPNRYTLKSSPIIQVNETNCLSVCGDSDFIFGPSNSSLVIESLDAFIVEAETIQIGKQKLMFSATSTSPDPFIGGETAAIERLNTFIWGNQDDEACKQHGKSPLSTYKDTRNKSIGDTYSSKFSMYLSLGCLSARTIVHEINKYEQCFSRSDSTYWLVFELLWRDFMKFAYLKHGDKFFHKNGIQKKPKDWWIGKRKIIYNEDDYVAFLTGNTGFPYVDAHMRELIQTGFMGNRGRQNVASFLVYNLNLDWRLGCELFEHFLLDHDCLSNAGNWQTIAGIGFQQRENRFNIVKQSLQYEKSGVFIKTWVPELMCIPAANVHTPWDFLADFPDKNSLNKDGAAEGGGGTHPLAAAVSLIPSVYSNPIRPTNSFYYEKAKKGNGPAWGGDWVEGGNIKIPSYSTVNAQTSKKKDKPKRRNHNSYNGKQAASTTGDTFK